ncbi:site-2 protease family protein, partial [Akkermansiaceae bacterium]|nr:site-2 protease family protein [Akkermansiaceae bacterium]
EETAFFRRRALPRVGIGAAGPAIIAELLTGENQSPAERAGLEKGDQVIQVNGIDVVGTLHVGQLLEENEWKESLFKVKRGDEMIECKVTPLKPEGDLYKDGNPKVGILWDWQANIETAMVHPTPIFQITDSLRTMWVTITKVTSPSSHIGVDQLAGPVGIARTKYLLLKTEDGWLRVMWFFVLFNVNLAVLNMLPLPVLDGGHIVMAIFEWVRGKPVNQRVLEIVQTGFALILIGFMLFITTKDLGDTIPAGSDDGKVVWPKATQ